VTHGVPLAYWSFQNRKNPLPGEESGRRKYRITIHRHHALKNVHFARANVLDSFVGYTYSLMDEELNGEL